ncbi:MAG: dienelactone hydrolase [Paraglaciecola sp.]|jgi:dienelactone hydrolase
MALGLGMSDIMQRIIVADIFGRTKALEQIADMISGDVQIFSPYQPHYLDFKGEADAYAFFSAEVGLDTYAHQLAEKIKTLTGPVDLLGFSIGASAIWKISDHSELSNVCGATGFYGSQIRHCNNVNPLFPVQLIFPITEQHFSVPELITVLDKKNNVQIHQSAFYHGFMNTHSQNFDQGAYSEFMQILSNVPLNEPIHRATFVDEVIAFPPRSQ